MLKPSTASETKGKDMQEFRRTYPKHIRSEIDQKYLIPGRLPYSDPGTFANHAVADATLLQASAVISIRPTYRINWRIRVSEYKEHWEYKGRFVGRI